MNPLVGQADVSRWPNDRASRASRSRTREAAKASTKHPAIHHPDSQSICFGSEMPLSMRAPEMPGPIAVENTMAETTIARMPPRLASPYTSGHDLGTAATWT